MAHAVHHAGHRFLVFKTNGSADAAH
jgi:hypothetical protein